MNEKDQLYNALLPFVDVFERFLEESGRTSQSRREWNEKMPDSFPITLIVTMGDFRKARAALERSAPKTSL